MRVIIARPLALVLFSSIALLARDSTAQHVVFVTGDNEYASELSMPMMAKILETHHGMKCTVLYSVNEKGERDRDGNSIPGLEALAEADAAVFFMRYRQLPDEQLNAIVAYAESDKPMLGLRTATHAFNYEGPPNNRWNTAFGRRFWGQQWIEHYGHGNSSQVRVVENATDHAILRGVQPDYWQHSWLYIMNQGELRMPADCRILMEGDAVKGTMPGGPRFGQRQPVAWTREIRNPRGGSPLLAQAGGQSYSAKGGSAGRSASAGGAGRPGDAKTQPSLEEIIARNVPGRPKRIFYTSLGHPRDFETPSTRRLLVNAVYWSLNREQDIPRDGSNVDIVGEYNPPDPR